LSKIIRYRCGHPTLASIQPASVNQNKTDLGSAFDSEKNGNALEIEKGGRSRLFVINPSA
ncbi:hypothetical protein, partial [Brucella cytisi]|uniref:hypothetical protein n=1 Tax=Brucella cytisi TaxID=407152 RepID=UPI00197D8558